MILRRLSHHVRTQNWIAVGLDFAIVVLGVFLGLQLGNANEARQAAAKEARVIERLTADFEKLEGTLAERIEATFVMMQNIDALLAIIEAGGEPADPLHAAAMIVDIFGVSVREAPPASYEELVASGGFAQLSDIALRDALAQYGQTNALWDYVELRSQALKEPDSPLVRALELRPGFTTYEKPEEGLAVDWEAFAEAKPALLLVTINLAQALDRHQKDLAAVQHVLEVLEDET